MTFSFIFPAYNEEKVIASQLRKFIFFVKQKYPKKFEILIVENGSTDKTYELLKKMVAEFQFIKLFKLKEPSYGLSLRKGLLNAEGKKIFFLNVDYFDFKFIEQANKLLNTVDIVIGSKTLSNSSDQRSSLRKIVTYLFNVFLRLILNYPGTDTHGIKAFRKTNKLIRFAKSCRTRNELFDTELVLRLTRDGAIFVDLPQKVVELRKSRYLGLRRIKTTIADLFSIIKTKYLFANNFLPMSVDADDFGVSDKVNKAILKEVTLDNLDIVSIMPNLVKKKDLLKLAKFKNKISYSMHFNLLRGRPCGSLDSVKTLVDKNGVFYPLPIFIFRLFFGLISFAEIKFEFQSQFQKMSEFGFLPDYLNSEQHLHIFSPINSLLEKELRKTSIRKIRSIPSSFHSLDHKLFRKCCLFILKKIFDLRFGVFINFKNKYDAFIVHPGI